MSEPGTYRTRISYRIHRASATAIGFQIRRPAKRSVSGIASNHANSRPASPAKGNDDHTLSGV